MFLHGLSPGMQDHRKPDFPAQILVPEFFQELGSRVDAELEQEFLVECDQGIENVIDGEDDMIVVDGQQPFLLSFEPLRFLEGPTLGTMAVLAGFVVELPLLTDRTLLHDAAHGRRAAIEDRTHGFGLLIRKTMCAFVRPDVLTENIRDLIAQRILWIAGTF